MSLFGIGSGKKKNRWAGRKKDLKGFIYTAFHKYVPKYGVAVYVVVEKNV